MASPMTTPKKYEETPSRLSPFCKMARKRTAEHDTTHRTDAAHQGSAAEDGNGKDVELLADHGSGHGLMDPVRLDESGNAGKEAEIAIHEELYAEDVDADPARRLGLPPKA